MQRKDVKALSLLPDARGPRDASASASLEGVPSWLTASEALEGKLLMKNAKKKLGKLISTIRTLSAYRLESESSEKEFACRR